MVPTRRTVRHVAPDGALLASGVAGAICLQLGGDWLPLEDVAVDVVGRYQYQLRHPLGGPVLPLVLDVLLVGRTKMLRLHSCVWLSNATASRLQAVVTLGAGCALPVVLGPGDRIDAQQRLHLRVGLASLCLRV